jgi:hypothetical protein
MKFNRSDCTYLLLLVFFSACILLGWFYKGNLFIGAEEGILFQRIDIVYEKMVSSVWLDLYLGIPYFSDLSKRPFYVALVFLFKHGIPPFFLQVFTIGLILSGTAVSSYLLFKNTLRNIPYYRLAAFTGALFYLINPYAISQIWGRGLYPQFFAYFYYPLFLLLVVYFFNSSKKIFLIIGLILSFVLSAAMGNPSFFVSLWIVVSVYWFFRSLEVKIFSKHFFRLSLLGIAFFIGWMGVNSWWLIVTLLYAPAAFLGEGNIFENSLTSLKAVSSQYTYLDLLRMYHPLHFESNLYFGIYSTALFQVISWMSFIVVLSGFKYLKIRQIWFYFSLFIIGLLVCLGTNPPLGWLFEWLFVNVSPLQVFRNPYEKFGLVFLLAYSGLFAVGSVSIFTFLSKLNVMIARVVIFTILSVAVIFFNWPLWTGELIIWGTQVKVPNRYQLFDSWQKKNNFLEQRILFTPFLSSLGASYHWGAGDYHGNDPLYQLIESSVITQTGTNSYLLAIKQFMGTKNLIPALERIRIGYIVDRPDVSATRSDKKSLTFLTKYFLQSENQSSSLCSNIVKESNHSICYVDPSQQDFSQLQTIEIDFKSNTPGFLEIVLHDKAGNLPRWVGDKNIELQYLENEINRQKSVPVYLFNPTENPNTDFSSIKKVEIFFRSTSPDANNFEFKNVFAIKGTKIPISDSDFQMTIDNLPIYKIKSNDPVTMVKAYASFKYVNSYNQLFDQFAQFKNAAFLMKSQNLSKTVLSDQKFELEIQSVLLDKDTYLVNLPKKGTYFLVLNQNFNPQWKITKNNSSPIFTHQYWQKLSWFLNDKISENNHYSVDGFANGWIVSTDEPASIVMFYQPNILMEILWPISLSFVGLLVVICFVWWFKYKN